MKAESIDQIDSNELRRCKSLVRNELQLNDGRISWLGNVEVSQNQAHALMNDLDDIEKRKAHLLIHNDRGLLRFLTHGELQLFRESRRATSFPAADNAFMTLVRKPFACQYGRALAWAYLSNNIPLIRAMGSIKFPMNSDLARTCVEACTRVIKRQIDDIESRTESCGTDPSTHLDAYKRLREEVEEEKINALPEEFTEVRSDLATAIRSFSITCFNKTSAARLARDILSCGLQLTTTAQVKIRLQHDWSKVECLAIAQELDEKLTESKSIESIRALKNIINTHVDPEELNRLPYSLPEDRAVIAGTIRRVAVKAFNEFGDVTLAVELTDLALRLSTDTATNKTLLDDNNSLRSEQKRAAEDAQRRKALASELESKISDITIVGGTAVVPNRCTCCLGKPSGEQKISYSWQETQGITRYNRSLSFLFPICSECLQHQREYHFKLWCIVLAACGLSSLLMWLIAASINKPEGMSFVVGGAVLAAVMLVVINLMIRLRTLAEGHACRAAAVTMCSASEGHCTFRFQNPIYADMFARANNKQSTLKPYTKPPRGKHILAPGGLVFPIMTCIIMSAISHFIIFGMMEASWKQRAASIASTNNPQVPSPNAARTVLQPQNRSPNTELEPGLRQQSNPPIKSIPPASPRVSLLSLQIDSEKAKVAALETEVDQMDSELESRSGTLKRLKSEIEDYERRVRLGISVNEFLYQRAIEDHNRLVRQYNNLIFDREQKYQTYQAAINSVNAMVARYNGGER